MLVSKSGFYQWLACKDKILTHLVELEDEIKKIHTSSRGTYGRRRILSTLKKSFVKVGKKRVSKIMRKLDLWGVEKPKFKVTTNVNKKALHSPNLIPGDFKAYKPNELWTSNITYVPNKEGWLYLCIILNTYSRAIVGWSMQEHLKRSLILDSLNMAYKNRGGFLPGFVFT